MFTPVRTLVLPLAFGSLLTVPGCGSGKVKTPSSGSASWSIAAEVPIPGVHKGALRVMTIKWPPSGVTVVLWSDGSGGSFRSDTREEQASFEGDVSTADGRRIPYRWVTADGITAQVTIDGAVYDSAKGSLFLISTQSQQPQVRQLSAEVRNFPREAALLHEYVQDYAQRTPEIATFFKEARNTKPVQQGK